ncbi:hypothetical protein [Caldibacillus sp. 210928-DFI.2.22]|uniref:hypothetical protein n=1 Tax=Caldibacillus sp. 210928-DFI.2.22 TaxID=2883265 RepID=UPI00126A4A5E|nr:hypothetical protein [Caldibacillus sp. 210928-DFI.2.22]
MDVQLSHCEGSYSNKSIQGFKALQKKLGIEMDRIYGQNKVKALAIVGLLMKQATTSNKILPTSSLLAFLRQTSR